MLDVLISMSRDKMIIDISQKTLHRVFGTVKTLQ